MTIQEIQDLLLNDFSDYKNKLVTNQKELTERFEDEHIFISLLDKKILIDKIDQTVGKSLDNYPLLGIPFVVKDNIDVLGFATTSGCKAYTYIPKESAFAVQQLEKAGAICIGKTNMDQFATGLVGTRSPYGMAKNYFNEAYIPGGSSSGSASAVAAGYVAFSLGTDTAGSGRVPAAFQNIIGFKPSKGVVSCTGVVPACKSLDCVSVFANELKDVELVLSIVSVYDSNDSYSINNNQLALKTNIKIAVPLKANLKFFGNEGYEKAYTNFITSLYDKNYSVEQIDFTPMFEAAKLLYGGPWLSERYHAVGEFITQHATEVNKTVLEVISGGKNNLATSYFDAEYKLKTFKKQFDHYVESYDAFVMPTVGTIYTKEEINENPIDLNTNLGYYTNFMNLLDCTAVALPVPITENKLPFGITLFAPALNDENLLSMAQSMKNNDLLNLPKPQMDYIDIAVCGAHKTGGSLNYQLLEIEAIYKSTLFTTPEYRFYALDHLDPIRPGLIKDPKNGAKIEVQLWKVPSAQLGGFINQIGAPLSFGKITLENGVSVTSFLCEGYALEEAKEITSLQTWEKYLETL